ncbi:nitroreductase family protein NDAI_0A00620 [Naumovozyma dairenensis CBS 421]|uniref:Nitroreductase domain-containing protein n=1 Tax=Naumovozyma dairenensis (strain ATCC 10597 / BCRC 20456 / CBS 421 / NBRC 0211 / NRRL Y-12639) TaxID=1071378 RepID=G0W332_NAUDC|nr:hypothetical protein NDAI_0A00620 [Naumovozyma dairenensis CBS 421]CCD22220.1 hypothetical protein NDAI_0A00620 [Naumovozyma dairenensis CBS 421]
MANVQEFLNTIENRRTIYNLKPELPEGITVEDIKETVQRITKNGPSAFNSQPNRALILTGTTHKKVWDSVVNAMPTDNAKMRPKACRDEAYGSVIFFVEEKATQKLQSDFAAFAEVFPACAQQSSGAVQIESWAAVEALGLGCNLQHYNPLVRAALPQDVPTSWTVHSQLIFGVKNGEAGAKEFNENPVKIYN